MAVRRRLNSMGQPTGQLTNECVGVLRIPESNDPKDDEFRFRVHGRSRPHILIAELTLFVLGQIPLRGAAE